MGCASEVLCAAGVIGAALSGLLCAALDGSLGEPSRLIAGPKIRPQRVSEAMAAVTSARVGR
ncbi:hypothetical protein D3M95_08955 [Corynebacterium falsenii]|uniref:Uncharacterized protein n=1 Tax=Corynebacterium falsenii TaxID=108486 RepID=A0A418Q5P9_9CORY|nr:hypothetical protein D3M95_08955 [Corynebacterium falsenii]